MEWLLVIELAFKRSNYYIPARVFVILWLGAEFTGTYTLIVHVSCIYSLCVIDVDAPHCL